MRTVTDAVLDKSPDLYVDLVHRWQEEQGVHNRPRGKVVPLSRYQDKPSPPPQWDTEEEEELPVSGLTRAMVASIVFVSLSLCLVFISLGLP